MELFAWGANSNAQCGVGYASEQVSRPTLVPIQFSKDNVSITKITGGSSSTLVLVDELKYPDIFEWQTNFLLIPSSQYKDIACGWDFDVTLDNHGVIRSRGSNAHFQLGRDVQKKSDEWGEIGGVSSSNHVSAGLRHCVATTEENTLVVWGSNTHGQISGALTDDGTMVKRIQRPTHEPVTDFQNEEDVRLKAAYCGKDFTIAVDDQSCLYGSGSNKFGVLCHAPQDVTAFHGFGCILEKTSTGSFSSRIEAVDCGWGHVVVLLEDGKVITWGRNDLGQLGRPSANPRFDVEPAAVILPEKIIKIATGSEHSLALGESGVVYAWGWNEHDNCGVDSTDKTNSCVRAPALVQLPGRAVAIGCGAGSSYAAVKSSCGK